jgi:glycosyltransferase involved in cell wall biosynthesis
MAKDYCQGWVSVITPSYNRADMLLEMLESVAAQSFRPIEIYIVDDGSTDRTAEVVKSFAAGFVNSRSTLQYVRQDRLGPSPARTLALQACSGEFIQFLDSDDLLHPDKLARQTAVLQDSAVDFVWSSSVKFTSVPNWSAEPFVGTRLDPCTGHEAIVPFIERGLWRTESGLYRRSTCRRTGPWRKLAMFQDWEYNIRMLSWSPTIRFVPGVLAGARQHSFGRIGDKWTNGSGLDGALDAVLLAEALTRAVCAGDPAWRRAVCGRYLEIAAQAKLCAYPDVQDRAEEVLSDFVARLDR